MASSDVNERKGVLLLCLLAAIHVFIFSAVFPVFNNVDEVAHFDLAVKYAQGHPPRAMDKLADETLNYTTVYSSQEYVQPPPPGRPFPPPVWTAQEWISGPIIAARRVVWNDPNHESAQPPLYYATAGAWWQFGKLLGFHGGYLLHWLRFMNMFVLAALVWLGYVAARLVFPENHFLRLAVPAMLACLPQTAFYSIGNDMFSAVCFGAAFILLVKLDRAEVPDVKLGACAGLALAATYLTKASNLPLLAVAAVFTGLKLWRSVRAGQFRAGLPAWLVLAGCAAVPVVAEMAWLKHNFGDFFGSAEKIQYLGWTHKPMAEWWQHPIFTPHGLWVFCSGLWSTLWQGEFMWYRKPLASPMATMSYALLTVVLLVLALAGLWSRRKSESAVQRRPLWFGFCGIVAAMVFLGFLSIIYDFHDCFYPSREYPYFTSGRLMLGALIPFMLLCLYGLDWLLGRWQKPWLRPAALVGLILFMLAVEVRDDQPAFASEYNWFHLQNVPAQAEAQAPVVVPKN